MININKVDSIQVHSNFIREHNFASNIYNYNTNTNKSSKSNTEPNNANLYMNDLPSGRSNNSGNSVFFVPPEKKIIGESISNNRCIPSREMWVIPLKVRSYQQIPTVIINRDIKSILLYLVNLDNPRTI